MRNTISHDYEDIKLEIIYEIATINYSFTFNNIKHKYYITDFNFDLFRINMSFHFYSTQNIINRVDDIFLKSSIIAK